MTWLTIDEAAQYLKVSKETLYKMAQKKQVPASKLGSRWRFNRELVDEWLHSQSNLSDPQDTKNPELKPEENTATEEAA